jgi:signal transduction histidine kinase
MKQITHRTRTFLRTLSTKQRGVIIISIPVTCLMTSLAAFAWLNANLIEGEEWVSHTQQVRIETKLLLTALVDAETGIRGYGLTRREEFLVPYRQALSEIPVSLDHLEELVDDNPDQSDRLQLIRARVDETLAILQQKQQLQQELIRLQTGQEAPLVAPDLLYDWLEEGNDLMNATRDEIDAFAQEEERLLELRNQNFDFYRNVTYVVLIISAIIGSGSGGLAIYLFGQLQKELNKRQVSLEETNENLQRVCDQLQRFTANASHELRAPLAAVLSNAQVGLMAPEEDAIAPRKRLEKIVAIVKSMSTLVGDLLFLARHEGRLANEVRQTLNAVDLVRAIAQDWHTPLADQGIHLKTDIPTAPAWISVDAGLLRQVITNLLSNASRYTSSGGWIRLAVQVRAPQVVITVEDTGSGIPEADLPFIFERFYQADKSRRRKGGFGLGLAIAQQIVHAHNGTITVNSIEKQGTIFTIQLPIFIAEPPCRLPHVDQHI